MKYKNIVLKIILVLAFIGVGAGMYHVNSLNYVKQKHIEALSVNHPEKLPSSEAAQLSSFGFENVMADTYWLRVIQYIGSNAVKGEYKKYLAAIMDIVTDLNPYFEAPYTIGQLLIPSSEKAYEDKTDPDERKNYRDGEKLGLKGVKNFCDIEKVNAIKAEDDLRKIIHDEKFKNPCKSYKIPYYLAYIYYFYLGENLNAAQYYKVVAAQEDAPEGAKVLAAIMQGKGGDREKSLFMFLSLAQNAGSDDGGVCQALTTELQASYSYIAVQKLPLTGEFVQSIENVSKQMLPKLSEKNEDSLLDDTECTNFLAKAIREINLMYLSEADKKYAADNPEEDSAHTPKKLKELGYINFIPTDFQRYDGEDYGIVYRYNDEIGRFDYEMGNIGEE